MEVKTIQEKQSPIEKLFQHSEPKRYKEVITEFWEGWLTNSENDNSSSFERSEKLLAWKHLIQFFEEMEKEKTEKN
jgi:hypothetical protein